MMKCVKDVSEMRWVAEVCTLVVCVSRKKRGIEEEKRLKKYSVRR